TFNNSTFGNVGTLENSIYFSGEINHLKTEDFPWDNTIYEITEDYDLAGETLVIPKNCVLRFNGGSIKNGIIQGDATKIEASPYNIFEQYTLLTGNVTNSCLYVEWFGAEAVETADSERFSTGSGLAIVNTQKDSSHAFNAAL